MRFVSRFFILAFFALSIALAAQSPAFEKLTIENGLSQGMIYDVLQTRDGFLWVATKGGLNRYDGYNFKVFANDPFDLFSIADNTIIALLEDSRGLLWAAIENKGLDVYDRRRGRFHHFPKIQALAFAEGKDGDLWVATQTELMRLAIPDTWEKALPDASDLSALAPAQNIRLEGYPGPSENLMSLWPKEDGNFVLFSSMRHFEVSAKEGVARPLAGPPFGDVARGTYQNGGHVWIARDSFAVYHLNGGMTTRCTTDSPMPTGPVNIQEDRQGNRWLLFKKSLWQLEPGRPIDYSKPDWVLDQDAKCLTSDRNGNLWVGTFGYGLRKINPKRKAFHSGASNNSIWRVWRSPQGAYYWRNYSIIYWYDAVADTSGKLVFPDLSETWKRDMVFDEDGSIWLLSTHKKDTTETLTAYGANGALKQQFKFDINAFYYSLLIRARDGNFWITEAGSSLSRFDLRSNQISRFDFSHLFGETAALVQAVAFVQDGNGDFWIGTQQGLVKCAMSSGSPQFQLIQNDPDNPQGLNHNSIACLLPDPVNPGERLWIGTKGGGINCLDIQSGQVRHFTVADGLPDMVVYGILPGNEDPQKERPALWCSTNRGLAKLAFPKQRTADEKPNITVFSVAKGLQGSEFNTQAFFKAANGELLFGGVNGLNRFFPKEVRSDTTPPPVFLVGLSINNRAADLRRYGLTNALTELRELRLGHKENNLSFEFAALDFTDPAQNRYRYRLVGLENDWVEAGSSRYAHYTHLPPGRYELRAQGSNGESGWCDATPIYIVVDPPWWRSDLAYLCYLLLVLGAGWRRYKLQIQRIKEREQLAFEQRETERIKALEQLKTNFFSNVTHEFRTPLTLMIEPLRQIMAQTKEPETRYKAKLAEENSRQLLGLVNQLLDMAKLESGQMALDLRRADLAATVRGVFERFLSLAEKRGVELTFENALPSTDHESCFDPGKVELVLNNLISNALKFTEKGGTVKIEIEKKTPDLGSDSSGSNFQSPSNRKTEPDVAPFNIHRSSFIIKISDTGIGIAPENLPKIFDRFYQVDPDESGNTRAGQGTGIGLALSKELAELMGGGISVESPDPKSGGKGSTFRFWLPVTVEDLIPIAIGRGFEDLNPDQSGEEPRNRPGSYSNEELPLPVHRPPSAEKPLVLVIEDNTDLRHFIKNSIGEGWQVVEAADGEAGVERALELVPDLIISDLMMPRKDGFAVCDELKNHELTTHIPIILLTAKSAVESKIKGFRTGADDYLTKPFNTEELLARMENMVETRRRLRERFRREMDATGMSEAADAPKFSGEALSAPDREFLQKFVLLIEENLDNDQISVDDFASKMFLSRSQLHRKLSAIAGQSTTDFVRDYRLAKAHTMLKKREGNVSQIADRTGFGNEKYFSRAFKDKYGISPSKILRN